MDVLIIVACFYFAYNCISSVVKAPFAEWTGGHWGSLAVGAVLGVLGVLRTVMYFKTYKSRRQEREEKLREEQQKLDEKRRRVYLYDDEEADETEPEPEKEEDDAFLDELFEKQARELGLEDGEKENAEDESGGDKSAFDC